MLGSHKQKAIGTGEKGLLMCPKPTKCTHKIRQERLVQDNVARMKNGVEHGSKAYEQSTKQVT
jgi:hypothetical protein